MSNVDPLSIWAKLDPFRAMREIEASVGHAVFDVFSFDPARFGDQLEEELGVDLTPEQILDPGGAAAAAIDEALESGSSPEWVPDDAVIHIDFVGNRAWTAADGEVAIDVLLGHDANAENGWGSTGYDAGDLVDRGLIYSVAPPALIGAALEKILAGATVLVRFNDQSGEHVWSNNIVSVMSFDGNDGIDFELKSAFSGRYFKASSWSGSLSVEIENIANDGDDAINTIAFTIVDGRVDIAANGSDAETGVVDETDRPPGNPFVAAVVDYSPGDPGPVAIQSITIYDPLPSTDGLSDLSATGVTNTAPTSLVPTFNGGVGSATGEASYEISATDLSTAVGGDWGSNDFVLISSITYSDAEGNPVTWTISASDETLNVTANSDSSVLITDDPGTGTFHFTVRATDLGGLYVEREITFTVTA